MKLLTLNCVQQVKELIRQGGVALKKMTLKAEKRSP